MGPRRGEDGGEGSGGVDTVGSTGTFWPLDIVESVVDDDGDGPSMVKCEGRGSRRGANGDAPEIISALRHYTTLQT